MEIRASKVYTPQSIHGPVTAVRATATGIARVPTVSGVISGGGPAANRPTNPLAIVYPDNPPGQANASLWAHPGALVLVGRNNYDQAWVHTMADGGATCILYLDCLVENVVGRYDDLLHNASVVGPDVPRWPGSPMFNEFGFLQDFRVGGTLQAKLPGVLDLIASELPHISGIFLDDCGTRAWTSMPWDSWSNSDKEAYRNGAIGIVQTARAKADQYNWLIIVNGTWQDAGAVGVGSGGYPNPLIHGCSLVDGGTTETHLPDAFWTAYCNGAQWATATPRDLPYMLSINDNTTARNTWIASNLVSHSRGGDYSTIDVPWGSFTNFNMPNRLVPSIGVMGTLPLLLGS